MSVSWFFWDPLNVVGYVVLAFGLYVLFTFQKEEPTRWRKGSFWFGIALTLLSFFSSGLWVWVTFCIYFGVILCIEKYLEKEKVNPDD